MNEMTIRLERNGAAAVPGGQLLLGYAGNRGNYRLRIEQRGEWKGLTVCAHWHTPGASAATLVENGVLTVPAAVTAVSGVGCITFEGTDGSRTVTSADVRCKVCANSGTAEGTMPAPDTPAWEALVGLLGTGGGSARLTIGTVTSGTTASASISGGKLNLVLPKGDTGPQGESGQSLFYPTRAAMIADSQLTEGCICLTLGYYKAQDGGGAEYLCQYLWSAAAYPWAVDLGERDAVEYRYALRPDGTPEVDEDGGYKLLTDADGKPIPVYEDDGVTPKKRHLYAMIQNQVVNYRMFGAVLDGVTDDDKALRRAHQYQHDTYTVEPETERRYYPVRVENHEGIIHKSDNTPITCSGNIDLSGSELRLTDDNAAWYGFYLWGDNDERSLTYEPTESARASWQRDKFVIDPSGKGGDIRANSIIHLQETPYSVRDDDGYLYSNPRYELLLHTADGVLANPLGEDWTNAGGMEIAAPYSDYDTHETKTKTVFSKFEVKYERLPAAHYTFTGCRVKLAVSADKYCTVLWCKCHSAHIRGFTIQPDTSQLHNTVFKNAMIYLFGVYNAEVSDIVGFNAAGKKDGSTNGTSGYVIRATNCLNLHIHDVSVQGYWGATAMNCVKDVHFERVNINRIDIHNYFYNLYIDKCNLFNHAVQIGEGRGVCQITNSNFYFDTLAQDSYPSAHIVEFNTTYGRIFSGKVLIENCRAYVKDSTLQEFDVCRADISPDAVSTLPELRFPEITVRGCSFYAYDPETRLVYLNIAGSRKCKTSMNPPTALKDHCRDTGNDGAGTLAWECVGYGFDWVEGSINEPVDARKGQFVRTYDSYKKEEGTTNFYNVHCFEVVQDGVLPVMTAANRPTDYTGAEFVVPSGVDGKTGATLKYVTDGEWLAKKAYAEGDTCYTERSYFIPPLCYVCTAAGTSNGYRPTHTSGTELEGEDVYPQNLDACSWEAVAPLDTFVTADFTAGMTVAVGGVLYAEGRLYQVFRGGTLGNVPPQKTNWTDSFTEGDAELLFLGMEWSAKSWRALGSYCISRAADGTDWVYQLTGHAGITSGAEPVRGNGRVVDGDIIWQNDDALTATKGAWAAQTGYSVGDVVSNGGHLYQCLFDGRMEMPGQIVLEDISTNMIGGDIAAFYTGTDVPTKLGENGKSTLRLNNLDCCMLPTGTWFGHAENPAPAVLDVQAALKKLGESAGGEKLYLDKTITATGTDAWMNSEIFEIPAGMTKIKITASSTHGGGGSLKYVASGDPWTTEDTGCKFGNLTTNGNNLVLNVSEGKIRPIFNLYSATSAENVFTIHLEGSERINRETAVGDIGVYKEKET